MLYRKTSQIILKSGNPDKGCFNLEHVQVLHILMSVIFDDRCIQNATSLKVFLYFATLCYSYIQLQQGQMSCA